MKRTAVIGFILLAIGIAVFTYYYYHNSVKLNITNRSNLLIDSLSINCGTEKIELSKLRPQSKTTRRLHSFTGQELSFTVMCSNQLIGHSISGANARDLSEINVAIEHDGNMQFVEIKTDLVK